jgi:hypothetical protein
METVLLALDEGADMEAKDSEQWTPLMRGGWWYCRRKYNFITLNFLVRLSLCMPLRHMCERRYSFTLS